MLSLALTAFAGCKTQPTTIADAGEKPVNVKEHVERRLERYLRDPASKKLVYEPKLVLMKWRPDRLSKWKYVWLQKVWVDAKNSQGNYVGPRLYWFLFKGEKLVKLITPQDSLSITYEAPNRP